LSRFSGTNRPLFPDRRFQKSRVEKVPLRRIVEAARYHWTNPMPLYPTDRHWGTFPLRELVEEVCRPLEPRLTTQAIQTVFDIPANQTITADRELLRRAVRNLVLNAIDAMPEGGTLVATSAGGPYAVELEIADTGPALSDEQREQAFELLPTSQRGGAGWGLAVVDHVAALHGGSVMAANCPEGGAAFTLRIPCHAALEAAA
jgi:signal transduction histidine kinase